MVHLPKHRVILLSGIGGLIVVVGIGALFILHSKQQPTKKTASATVTQSTAKVPSVAAQQKIEQADAQAASGDVTGAAKALSDAASSAQSTSDKTAYYMQAATLLSNNGQSDAAVAAARSAINADPSNGQLYANLGYIYESLGDNPSAVTAFQEALKLMKQNPPDIGSTENGGQAQIEGQLQRLGASS